MFQAIHSLNRVSEFVLSCSPAPVVDLKEEGLCSMGLRSSRFQILIQRPQLHPEPYEGE